MPALIPMRSQRVLVWGKVDRRAAIGFVPIAAFQASAFEACRRLASKPTPNRVEPRGGSAIIVVIRVRPQEIFTLGTWWFREGPAFPSSPVVQNVRITGTRVLTGLRTS